LRLRLPITAKDKGQLELAQIILQHVITTNIYIIISYDVFLFRTMNMKVEWLKQAHQTSDRRTSACHNRATMQMPNSPQ
jgi:hypothetical protein